MLEALKLFFSTVAATLCSSFYLEHFLLRSGREIRDREIKQRMTELLPRSKILLQTGESIFLYQNSRKYCT